MRGRTDQQMTIVVVDPEELIPEQHPIRRVRPFVEAALSRLEPTFEEMYAKVGRPSIPPEQLLKASVLMAPYSIRSERQFCERLQYGTTCSSSGSLVSTSMTSPSTPPRFARTGKD